jgi:hypothetical protein
MEGEESKKEEITEKDRREIKSTERKRKKRREIKRTERKINKKNREEDKLKEQRGR